MSYDRYRKFRKDTSVGRVCGVDVPELNTDIFYDFDPTKDRMDLVSYNFYGDANYDWLILQANRELPAYEFLIPSGTRIRVPYPLEVALRMYEREVDNYKKFYSNE